MLKQYFAVLLTLTLSSLQAQNNLIIIHEDGAKFILYVNDQQINTEPQVEVKATHIDGDTCHVKLVSETPHIIQTLNTRAYLTIGKKSVHGYDFTYSLVHGKTMSELKFISVNLAESDSSGHAQKPEKRIKAIFTEIERKKIEEDRLKENYPPPGTCPAVVADSVLARNLKLLRDNHIELNRVKDAKWFVSHQCLTTNQLKEVMNAFDRQDSKVEIAEFAYVYLQTPADFLQVLDAVKYVTEKEDLKKFYEQQKK